MERRYQNSRDAQSRDNDWTAERVGTDDDRSGARLSKLGWMESLEFEYVHGERIPRQGPQGEPAY